jgi:hypothetical protein
LVLPIAEQVSATIGEIRKTQESSQHGPQPKQGQSSDHLGAHPNLWRKIMNAFRWLFKG